MLKLIEEKEFIELKDKISRLEKLIGKVVCLECKGEGQIGESMGSYNDFFKCEYCGGTGRIR